LGHRIEPASTPSGSTAYTSPPPVSDTRRHSGGRHRAPRIAIAENYPARPLRIIAGFAAGGGVADETGKWARVVRSAGIKPD